MPYKSRWSVMNEYCCGIFQWCIYLFAFFNPEKLIGASEIPRTKQNMFCGCKNFTVKSILKLSSSSLLIDMRFKKIIKKFWIT